MLRFLCVAGLMVVCWCLAFTCCFRRNKQQYQIKNKKSKRHQDKSRTRASSEDTVISMTFPNLPSSMLPSTNTDRKHHTTEPTQKDTERESQKIDQIRKPEETQMGAESTGTTAHGPRPISNKDKLERELEEKKTSRPSPINNTKVHDADKGHQFDGNQESRRNKEVAGKAEPKKVTRTLGNKNSDGPNPAKSTENQTQLAKLKSVRSKIPTAERTLGREPEKKSSSRSSPSGERMKPSRQEKDQRSDKDKDHQQRMDTQRTESFRKQQKHKNDRSKIPTTKKMPVTPPHLRQIGSNSSRREKQREASKRDKEQRETPQPTATTPRSEIKIPEEPKLRRESTSGQKVPSKTAKVIKQEEKTSSSRIPRKQASPKPQQKDIPEKPKEPPKSNRNKPKSGRSSSVSEHEKTASKPQMAKEKPQDVLSSMTHSTRSTSSEKGTKEAKRRKTESSSSAETISLPISSRDQPKLKSPSLKLSQPKNHYTSTVSEPSVRFS